MVRSIKQFFRFSGAAAPAAQFFTIGDFIGLISTLGQSILKRGRPRLVEARE
jgi:hypothetical protein